MAEKKSKRVVLTRENNDAVADILKAQGVDVLELPMIKIEFSSDASDVSEVFAELGRYDWLTFSSVNGVRGFFNEFFKNFDDIRCLGIARIACVGEATARELKKYFLHADVLPKISTGAEMAKAMVEYESLENLRVLCVIGNLAGKEMFEILEEKGKAIVDEFQVYKTVVAEIEEGESASDFREFGADAIVFSSPSAVEGFAKNAKKLLTKDSAARPKIAAIGSVTAEAVKKYGMKVSAVAADPLPESVAAAVMSLLK